MFAPLAVLALLAHAGAVQPAVARAAVPPFLGQAEGSSQAGEAGPSAPRDDVPAAVFVDVIATDSRGRSVETLTQADFELREDGTPQSIDAVRFVKKANPSGAVEPGPTNRVRVRRAGCRRCSEHTPLRVLPGRVPRERGLRCPCAQRAAAVH